MENQENNNGSSGPIPRIPIPKQKKYFKILFFSLLLVTVIAVVLGYGWIKKFPLQPNSGIQTNQAKPELSKSEQGLSKTVSPEFQNAFIAKKSSLILPKTTGVENNISCANLPKDLLWFAPEKINGIVCKEVVLENGKLAYGISGNYDYTKARMIFDDLYWAAQHKGWIGLNFIVTEGLGFFDLDSLKYQSRAEISFSVDNNELKIFIFEK